MDIEEILLGDIDRLKEYTLCNFEYLLSKIHGLSIDQLLWEFDIICSNILDADILLVQATLKYIANTVATNPMLLAGEVILRLKSIKSIHSSISSIGFAFSSLQVDTMNISNRCMFKRMNGVNHVVNLFLCLYHHGYRRFHQ